MNKQKIEIAILLIIIVLSTINIQNQIGDGSTNIPSLCLSILGVTGVIFYLVKPNSLKVFLYIWLSLQLFVIESNVFDNKCQAYINAPVWDLTQVLSFKVGLNITSGDVLYGLSVNLPNIIIIYLVNKFWK